MESVLTVFVCSVVSEWINQGPRRQSFCASVGRIRVHPCSKFHCGFRMRYMCVCVRVNDQFPIRRRSVRNQRQYFRKRCRKKFSKQLRACLWKLNRLCGSNPLTSSSSSNTLAQPKQVKRCYLASRPTLFSPDAGGRGEGEKERVPFVNKCHVRRVGSFDCLFYNGDGLFF